MLIAKPITITAKVIDPAASSIIRSLADGLIADVSGRLIAVAVQKVSDG